MTQNETAGQGDVYLAERIREALANDPEVGELGLKVRVERNTVFLNGLVTTEERRRAAQRVASGLAPGAQVIEELEVSTAGDTRTERLE